MKMREWLRLNTGSIISRSHILGHRRAIRLAFTSRMSISRCITRPYMSKGDTVAETTRTSVSVRHLGEFEVRWNMRAVPPLILDRLVHSFTR